MNLQPGYKAAHLLPPCSLHWAMVGHLVRGLARLTGANMGPTMLSRCGHQCRSHSYHWRPREGGFYGSVLREMLTYMVGECLGLPCRGAIVDGEASGLYICILYVASCWGQFLCQINCSLHFLFSVLSLLMLIYILKPVTRFLSFYGKLSPTFLMNVNTNNSLSMSLNSYVFY